MTEEQEARITVEELCIPGWAKTVDKALDDYRATIVAATNAEYEAKLGDLRLDAARWRYVRDNATRMVSPIQNYITWNADAGVVASFCLTLPSVPPFATQPEAAIDAARTPSPEQP